MMDKNNSVQQPNTEAPKKTNRLAIVSLALGGLGLLLFIVYIYVEVGRLVDWYFETYIAYIYFLVIAIIGIAVIGMTAVVIGAIALNRFNKQNASDGGYRYSIFGIILGAISIVLSISSLIFTLIINYYVCSANPAGC